MSTALNILNNFNNVCTKLTTTVCTTKFRCLRI